MDTKIVLTGILRDKNDINIILSNEHCDYKWVSKESLLMDDFIKDKLSNL